MRITPFITLNVNGAYFPSGVPIDVDDEIAENAISLGLASLTIDVTEAATVDPPETATTRAKRKR